MCDLMSDGVAVGSKRVRRPQPMMGLTLAGAYRLYDKPDGAALTAVRDFISTGHYVRFYLQAKMLNRACSAADAWGILIYEGRPSRVPISQHFPRGASAWWDAYTYIRAFRLRRARVVRACRCKAYGACCWGIEGLCRV
jgi:hypothetical protein